MDSQYLKWPSIASNWDAVSGEIPPSIEANKVQLIVLHIDTHCHKDHYIIKQTISQNVRQFLLKASLKLFVNPVEVAIKCWQGVLRPTFINNSQIISWCQLSGNLRSYDEASL